MAENLKAELKITYSENSDYTDPEWVTNWDAYEMDPDSCEQYRIIAATGGTTLNVDHLTAASAAFFAVKNTDSTNYVSITVRAMGDADDAVLRVYAGQMTCLAIDPVTDPIFTANSAAVDCKVLIAQDV